MPYDPIRKIYTPDFNSPQQPQGWQDMGEDQPIDIGPAAGAFKQRFMQKPMSMGTGTTPMPSMNDLPMDMGGMDAGGGAAVKKGIKSL